MKTSRANLIAEINSHKFPEPHETDRVNTSFSENAMRMMKKRYLARHEDGTQETPAEMLHRIAHAVAAPEREVYGKTREETWKWEREFFEIMVNKEFTPAGRTITNAGALSPVVANCIVLPVDDSMEGIFKTLKDAALLQKAGSGMGFSFGRLRPAGTFVKTSAGMASGPVSFLLVYNQAFGVIKQQGRTGANMAILPVDHPDILDFINCKRIEGEIRNFNISVGMTDEFMKAVIERPNDPWMCQFADKKMKPRRIDRDRQGIVIEIKEADITAKELYDEIVKNAWHNGEPGVIFLDSFNRFNTMPKMPIEATNPCGEQGLPPYDVCNLGSINLAAFVKPASPGHGGGGEIDLPRLKHVTMVAIRFLDNVVDLFDYPVKEVQQMSQNSRRVGLGVMGFADMLYELGVRYDSVKGLDVAELVMKTIEDEAHNTSVSLAQEKGVFPLWSDSSWAKKGIKRRNAMVTTVAPTGTISMFFDTSSGIEPNFALSYVKQDKDGITYRYVNKFLEEALRHEGLFSEELMQKIIHEGSLQNISEVPVAIRETFRVAMDISPSDHIRMQAAFQKYVENSISKTINFPFEATVNDIEDGFILAWKLGCKGCTLYRDGSREVQVLNLNKNLDKAKSLAPGKEKQALGETLLSRKPVSSVAQILEAKVINGNHSAEPAEPQRAITRERPDVMQGMTYRVRTSYGNLFVTINQDEHGPFEVFSQLGKAGGFFQAQTEAICRLISLALRSGVSIKDVIDQLKGIRGPDIAFANGGTIHSLPDAIGKVLENHIKRGQKELALRFTPDVKPKVAENPEMVLASSRGTGEAQNGTAAEKVSIANLGYAPACPDCGSSLTFGEGCLKCDICGFSKCG